MEVPSFIPLDGRARWAMILLAVTIGTDIVAVGSDIWEIALIGDFLSGRDTDTSALAGSDDRQALVGLIELAAHLVAAAMFIRWFYAAYRNTASLGKSELHFKPGWAIGAWFVPILNLWRPKQIANEIWTASDPEVREVEGSASRAAEGTGLLTLWWAGWIVSGIAGNIVTRLVFTADTLDDIRDSDKLDVVALAVGIATAVLAILVVRRITDRQLAWARRAGQSESY